MALNLPGVPFKLTPQDMGGFDLGAALHQGFGLNRDYQEAKVLPKTLSENLLAAQLTNKINQAKAKYAEQNQAAGLQSLLTGTRAKEADMGLNPFRQRLLQAQTERALRGPQPVLSNLEKAIAGSQRIKQQYGENSPEAQAANSYIQRLAQGSQGLQLTTDPTTGALTSLSFGGSSRGDPQSILTTDENGNKVVVSKPTTAQSTTQQKSSLSEIGRSTIAAKAEMPYVGSGSNAEILADRLNYSKNGDKKAGERLVKAAVAKMIAPEYAGFQLASQGIAATIPALKHQYEAIQQGWPAASNLVVENLPKELQQEAKKQHAKLLAEIKKAKETHAAKGYPVQVGKNTEELIYNPSTGRLE